MRVLLVEDNSELVSLLKKGLSHGGFSADSVGTAADAVHVLATMRYAAIVLDLGRVLVEGKPNDVVRDPKVISAYLGDRHAVSA